MLPKIVRPPVNIGTIIYHACLFNPQNQDSLSMNRDQIAQAVAQLWALLKARNIEHLLVGGVALLQYVEGRNTEDIDLILAASALDQLPEIDIKDRNINFAYGKLGDLQVDVLFTQNPLFATVQRDYATERDFAGERIRCATVEGLILLKLYALPSVYRAGNFARGALYETDIATLYEAYRPDLQPIFSELAKHLSSSDFAEVNAVMSDIRRRVERFDKGRG